MKNELLTVQEFADAAGISKQAVYKALNNKLKPFVQLVDGKKMLKSQALCEIYGVEVEQPDNPKLNNQGQPLEAVIATLQRELEVKNGQIEALQHQNELLTSALEHTTSSLEAAHALHAGTIQQNLLESTAEDLADRDYVETLAEDPKEETSPNTPSEAELLLEQLATSRGFKKRRLLKQIRKRGSHGAHI